MTTFTVWLTNDNTQIRQKNGLKWQPALGICWVVFEHIFHWHWDSQGWYPRQGWFFVTLLETYLWRHTRWRLSPPSWILSKSAETEGERRKGRETSLIKENWRTFTGHCEYTNSPKKKNVGEFYWGWMGREHVLSMVKKGGWGQGKKIAVYV